MIISTTPSIGGRQIKKNLNIVSGDAVLGRNTFIRLFFTIGDLVGGCAGRYEKELRSTREEAINDMIAETVGLGGNAVVGIDLDDKFIGQTSDMLMVSINGAAVVLA